MEALRPCYALASQGDSKAYGRAGALRPLSARRLLERGYVVLLGAVPLDYKSHLFGTLPNIGVDALEALLGGRP